MSGLSQASPPFHRGGIALEGCYCMGDTSAAVASVTFLASPQPRTGKSLAMSEFTLDALTSGRDGVKVWGIELRRTTLQVVSADRLASGGLETIGEMERAFQLPTELAPGATYFSASLEERPIDAETSKDVWTLYWDRMPNTDVPPDIREAEVPTLTDRLKAFWAGQADPAEVELHVHYVLTGYEVLLEQIKPRKFGTLSAMMRAAYWTIEGAKHLMSVSPLDRSDETPAQIFVEGGFSSVGFPRVDEFEATLWSEVQTLLKRSEQ